MAFYLIIIIGIILILVNYNAIKKEKKSFNNIFNHEVNNMEDFKVLIEENNEKFKETIFDIQKEIQGINEKFNYSLKSNNKSEKITVEKVEIYDKMNVNSNSNNSVKINEIKDLLKRGLSIEDIAEKLNIGKGEVLLIKELYLR